MEIHDISDFMEKTDADSAAAHSSMKCWYLGSGISIFCMSFPMYLRSGRGPAGRVTQSHCDAQEFCKSLNPRSTSDTTCSIATE